MGHKVTCDVDGCASEAALDMRGAGHQPIGWYSVMISGEVAAPTMPPDEQAMAVEFANERGDRGRGVARMIQRAPVPRKCVWHRSVFICPNHEMPKLRAPAPDEIHDDDMLVGLGVV